MQEGIFSEPYGLDKAKRYEVIRTVGRGAFGEVRLETESNRNAIKIINRMISSPFLVEEIGRSQWCVGTETAHPSTNYELCVVYRWSGLGCEKVRCGSATAGIHL